MEKYRRKCKLDPNIFCYICGCFATPKQRTKITDFVKKAYAAYFGMKLGDQEKSWAPHSVCRPCVENLRQWTKGKRSSVGFGIPMAWREQQNHFDDCYFCMVDISGFTSKTKSSISYPNLPSAIRPVPHSDVVPVPVFNKLDSDSEEVEQNDDEKGDTRDEDFNEIDSNVPQLFSQGVLNNLIRDLELSKRSAELLASRLKDKNLLASGRRVTIYTK